jgi:hypothetical protein
MDTLVTDFRAVPLSDMDQKPAVALPGQWGAASDQSAMMIT